MLVSRIGRRLGAPLATLGLLGAGAATAVAAGPPSGPPPPPTTPGGKPAQLVATGLQTPTSFAFGAGQVFAGDAGSQSGPKVPGGVFVLANGKATRVAGSPPVVFGLTWRGQTLYVSALNKILTMTGWNGSKFAKIKTIYTAPPKFSGFNGLGFGANGRLYAGVDVGQTNDHGPASTPYLYDVLTMTATGKHVRVFASGIRQPWQLAFPRGSSSPFVSDFGQDKGATNPPDFLLRLRQGQDYGFPHCNWTKPKACKGFARPFKFFAPHTDVGGLAIVGSRLYMSEFGFVHKPLVVSIPLSGGAVRTELAGFVAPIIGLGAHGGYVYVGELTGQVFRFRP